MDMELLKKLTATAAAPGCEDRVRDIIAYECEPLADEAFIDAMGNLIVHKKGEGRKIMLSAHMDRAGVIVTFIDDDGLLRFSPLGGLKADCLPGTRIRFESGTVGVICLEGEAEKPKISDMYVDIGAFSKEEAQKLIRLGETGVPVGELESIGSCIISPCMDGRIGCLILIETLRALKHNSADCWFAFTVQEELGFRGAKPAAFRVEPELALVVDMTASADTPGCSEKSGVRLGKGAVIKLMDSSLICSRTVIDGLKNAAEQTKTAVQPDAGQTAGSEGGVINLSRGGVPTGVLAVPARYIGTGAEMVCASDIEACVAVLTEALKTQF